MLERAVRGDLVIAEMHMPFPGFTRIGRSVDAYTTLAPALGYRQRRAPRSFSTRRFQRILRSPGRMPWTSSRKSAPTMRSVLKCRNASRS
jgi:hypothetical protein